MISSKGGEDLCFLFGDASFLHPKKYQAIQEKTENVLQGYSLPTLTVSLPNQMFFGAFGPHDPIFLTSSKPQAEPPENPAPPTPKLCQASANVESNSKAF